MLSVYGMTIQVINFKEETLSKILLLLEDIIDYYEISPYPNNLSDDDIKSLLHNIHKYYVKSVGDSNCVVAIKFDLGNDEYDIYRSLFNWYINKLFAVDLSDVFKSTTIYYNQNELKFALKCLVNIMYREEDPKNFWRKVRKL